MANQKLINLGLALQGRGDVVAARQQKELDREQEQEIAKLEAKNKARKLIADNIDNIDPEIAKKEFNRLNQEIVSLGGEKVPFPGGRDFSGRIGDLLNRFEVPDLVATDFENSPAGLKNAREFATSVKGGDLSVKELIGADGTRRTVFLNKKGQAFDTNRQPISISADDRLVNPPSVQGSVDETELGSTENRELRDTQVATENFLGTTGDAIQLLIDTPDINTFVAGAAAVVNGLQQEAAAIARAVGVTFAEGESAESLLDPSRYEESFDRLGIQNARMKSIITSLAFGAAAAAGQTGRAISDKDIERFIKEIGASHADPRAFAAVLTDVANRTARNFKNSFKVRTGRDFEGDLGLSSLPKFGQSGTRTEDISDEELRQKLGLNP